MLHNAKAGISDHENGSPNESRKELLRRAVRAEERCVRIQARLDKSLCIAHDFNNILTVLVGNLDLVMMFELEENHPAQKGLGKALAAGQRAKELVDQILTFSRRQEGDLQPLKATLIIREVRGVPKK